jgi:hypothetical protein
MRALLNDGDLFRRQVVEFIDQVVDLAVERGAFAFVKSLVTLSARRRELLLCFEHLIDELNHSESWRSLSGCPGSRQATRLMKAESRQRGRCHQSWH